MHRQPESGGARLYRPLGPSPALACAGHEKSASFMTRSGAVSSIIGQVVPDVAGFPNPGIRRKAVVVKYELKAANLTQSKPNANAKKF
jgi:hypothetical protein